MAVTYPRGSEWRRWDLHVHTPGTALADGFGDWSQYLDSIESADPRIAVVGITDYLTLRNYKRVLAYRGEGRLSNIALIIPNIEFRLTPLTKRGKALNVHLLVSPDDPSHTARVDEALAQLTIARAGDVIPCTEEGLTRLGVLTRSELKGEQDAAFREGVNQFKPSFDAFREWLVSQAWLRRNSLVAVANSSFDGVSGLQEDSGLKSTRDEIYRFAHIVFSGRPRDREFFLGKSHGLMYGGPKPCLHGSDAHDLAHLFRPDENRYCWVKADPTFEGLRQTLYEPEERVVIGEEPPQHHDPDGIINSITLSSTGTWFEQRTIPLNSGLVAIVGLKGSGKTALADLIAFAAGAGTDPEESFLARAGENLKGLEIDIAWASGLKDHAVVPHEEGGVWGNSVKYLSQRFVERLCTGGQVSEVLLQEVETVVFSHIPPENRYGAGDFAELRQIRTEALEERRAELAESIGLVSREIGALHARRQEIRGRSRRIDEVKRLIQSSRKSRPQISDKTAASRLKRLEEAREQHDHLVTAVAELQKRRQLVEDARRKVGAKLLEVERFWDDLRDQLEPLGFDLAEIDGLKPRVNASWEAIFTKRVGALDKEIADLTGNLEETGQDVQPEAEPRTLTGWKAHISSIEKGIDLDSEKQKLVIKSQQQEERLSTELAKLEMEAKWVEEEYPKEIRRKGDERKARYLEFFELLSEEREVLFELYQPLRVSLDAQGQHERKLELVCRVHVNLKAWVEEGELLFDLRKLGPLRGIDLNEFARRELEVAWRSCDQAAVSKGVEKLLEIIKEADVVKEHLRSGKTSLDLARWVFSVDHISLSYAVRYEGKDLRLLSPGTKGIVLLILYLSVDRADSRPLMVDQPDENLDNQSIFEILRGYLREAKRRRQVIIITHNPNLVVNTDAEQIIVAQAETHEGGLPTIRYSSGSLEADEADGPLEGSIREAICEVLEGGREAFRMRERRYASLWAEREGK